MTPSPRSPIPGLEPESEDRRQARKFGRYAGVGLQFAVAVIVFFYAGQWVDRKFGSDPWGVVVGVFVGAGAAFYGMYRQLMADLQRDERARGTRR
jgi:F0F1-type ATP synthase assembly protein I